MSFFFTIDYHTQGKKLFKIVFYLLPNNRLQSFFLKILLVKGDKNILPKRCYNRRLPQPGKQFLDTLGSRSTWNVDICDNLTTSLKGCSSSLLEIENGYHLKDRKQPSQWLYRICFDDAQIGQ